LTPVNKILANDFLAKRCTRGKLAEAARKIGRVGNEMFYPPRFLSIIVFTEIGVHLRFS
jgi:hypothetical protein